MLEPEPREQREDAPAAVQHALDRVVIAQQSVKRNDSGPYRAEAPEALRWVEHELTRVGLLDDVVFIPDHADASPKSFAAVVGVVLAIIGIGVAIDKAKGDWRMNLLAAAMIVGGIAIVAWQRRQRQAVDAEVRRTGLYLVNDELVMVTPTDTTVHPRRDVVGFRVDRGGERSRFELVVLEAGQERTIQLSFPGVVGGLAEPLEAWRRGGLPAFVGRLEASQRRH